MGFMPWPRPPRCCLQAGAAGPARPPGVPGHAWRALPGSPGSAHAGAGEPDGGAGCAAAAARRGF